jgi:hypothetical protein
VVMASRDASSHLLFCDEVLQVSFHQFQNSALGRIESTPWEVDGAFRDKMPVEVSMKSSTRDRPSGH